MKNKNDQPIIKMFIQGGHYYFYDAYYNAILEVTGLQYKELAIVTTIGIAEYLSLSKSEKEYEDICVLIRKGLLKPQIIKNVENSLTPYINQMLTTCVNVLVLQVTQVVNI